jgi:hypothetical protein
MKRISIKTIGLKLACVLLMGALYSCQDDPLDSHRTRVEEGLPATVNLKLKVNDMGTRSRTIANEDAANYCDNIWIGFYSADDGTLKDKFYITDVANTSEEVEKEYALSVKTQSVNDIYIVAVANSDVNSGVSAIGEYGNESKTLREMLDAADTYDKFKAICLLRPDASDVNVYANTLTMSGWYADTDNGDSYTDPTKVPVVNIEAGENNLSGAIYLRRVLAYNKFIIVPGDNITLTLNTWKVCNVPAGCYLFEQADNIGDHYVAGTSKFYNSTLASRLFTADENAKGEAGKSFEFYQVENKHTAVDYASLGADDHVGIDKLEGQSEATKIEKWYNEREREFKTDNNDGTNNVTNTGYYKSLVASTTGNLTNNDASYVVVNADVDYYYSYYKLDADGTPTSELSDPTTAVAVDPATFQYKTVHRMANINYTIHLGYCEDQNSDGTPTYKTATDFNCRRNTKYLYNVKINGVNNVVIEAKRTNENQPGTDGWVSDETGEFERLDAHYCEFNIALTDDERKNMGYRITAPYNGKYYYYSRDKEGNITHTENMNKELYSWIEFYPTSDENTLAEYNGGKGKNTLGEGTGLWTFNDMCAPDVKDSPYAADTDGKKWYTVFVDEYVYHFDDQGDKETSWPYYCNQDDRLAEFIMHDDQSTDLESEYSYCKYAFSQRSIQTYYKGTNVGDRAIGVEHYEETYCLNMNWNYLTGGWSNEHNETDYDVTNGRYNEWHYLDTKNLKNWSAVIQPTVPGHVDADGSETFGCYHPDADYPVYMPKPFSTNGSRPTNSPSPKDRNTYYANSICMNRNRNSGTEDDIDIKDVKWFLPTSSQYIQICISQGELPSPIFRFTDYDPDYFIPIWASYTTRSGRNDAQEAGRYGTYNYHYITSDYQYFFAEQLASVGDNPFSGWVAMVSGAYTARCIRNLGTDLSEPVKDQPEVDNAFSYDENTRIFNQYNFKDETLRGYSPTGLAPHSAASVTAHPYKKFQVAKNQVSASDEYLRLSPGLGYVVAIDRTSTGDAGNLAGTRTDLWTETTAWTNSLKQNGICGQYYENTDKSDLGTWRIPSIGEIGIMWIQKLYDTDKYSYLSASYDYFVSYKLRNLTGDNHLYLGYFENNNDRHAPALDVLDRDNIRMRCVRDVK